MPLLFYSHVFQGTSAVVEVVVLVVVVEVLIVVEATVVPEAKDVFNVLVNLLLSGKVMYLTGASGL